jgi:hypothetical protein
VQHMFRRIRALQSAVADYTVGTIIVMVHMATADRRVRVHALPAPSRASLE